MSSLPSTAPKNRRNVALLSLLGLVGVIYVVSLPWQRQQWEIAEKIKKETAVQEARLRDLKAQQGQVHDAEKRVQISPADVNARLDAVRAHLAHNDMAGAGTLLQQIETDAYDQIPSSDKASFASTLSGLYQQAGWVDRALANAQRAVDASPNDMTALLRLGVIETEIGWPDEARKHITAAVKAAPNAAEPHLALALIAATDPDAEAELLAADRARPNDLHIALLLFRNRMQQRQYDKALATLDKALKTSPAEPGLYSARAEALIERAFAKPGKPDAADLKAGLEAAKRYAELAPDDKGIHYLIGRALQGLGDETGTLKEWETAYAAQPGQQNLAINLGRLLIRHGQAERGKKMIAASEASRPLSSEYNRHLLTTGMKHNDPEKQRDFARWCQTHGRLSYAILGWDQVLKLKPGDAEALRERDKCRTLREQGHV